MNASTIDTDGLGADLNATPVGATPSRVDTNTSLVDKIARAVLYEGYILYPYRPSVKTQQRWTLGGIYPRSFSQTQQSLDPCSMQTQCLLRADGETALPHDVLSQEGVSREIVFEGVLGLCVRFLHLTARTVEAVDPHAAVGQSMFYPLPSIEVGGRLYQTWQEANERRIELPDVTITDLLREPRHHAFSFPHYRSEELLFEPDGRLVGRLVREQQQIDGTVELSAERKADGVIQLTARVSNDTPLSEAGIASREIAQLRSFASTHLILSSRAGGFISLTDPPESLANLAAECSNVGCWPVLVGAAGATDTLLASPIILSDYPEIADESPGDLFDGCEIDEILTLRILTLTDEEKRQAIAVDPLAADMMARTESLAREQLMNLHGTVRNLKPVSLDLSESPTLLGNSFEETPVMSEAYYG